MLGMPTSFVGIIALFDETRKYGDSENFWVYIWRDTEPHRVEVCNITFE
jgi:hypothetical protein